jgi:hypothetical protein
VPDWPSLDVDMGQLLEDLSSRVEDAPRDATLAAVRARLESEPTPDLTRTTRQRWRTRTVRLALVGLAVVVVFSLVLTVSPAARRAVADWLGIPGVLVERRNGPPPTNLGGHLVLGQPVGVAEAQRRVSFGVLLAGQFGSPEEVYVAGTPSGGRVSLLYRARSGLPQAGRGGVGLLLTEFRGQVNVVRKGVGPGGRIEQVTVGAEPGYWFQGRPHQVTFADKNGQFFDDNSRLAGNTLVWEHGALTLRLEAEVSKDRAIQIAESLGTRR